MLAAVVVVAVAARRGRHLGSTLSLALVLTHTHAQGTMSVTLSPSSQLGFQRASPPPCSRSPRAPLSPSSTSSPLISLTLSTPRPYPAALRPPASSHRPATLDAAPPTPTGPLTQLVKRSLAVSNHNSQAVAYKVKTTAPKQYCVRPNSGRIEPGETVEVQGASSLPVPAGRHRHTTSSPCSRRLCLSLHAVLLQPMKEDPAPNAKCRDKFLVQSVLVTPEREDVALAELVRLASLCLHPRRRVQRLARTLTESTLYAVVDRRAGGQDARRGGPEPDPRAEDPLRLPPRRRARLDPGRDGASTLLLSSAPCAAGR